ncbi:MAG: hypothetical protein GY775_19340 [Candidatus Scalindua sp.]|nr:hypothetical protein [Candidatus Scalindua sp.]
MENNKELEALIKGFLRSNVVGMAGINTKGNIQKIIYYAGIEAGNPSGDKNIKLIEYYDSDRLHVTEVLSYDADNDIIEIKTI